MVGTDAPANPGNPRGSRIPNGAWLGLGLFTVVFACYGRLLALPLVQDDWGLMARFAGESIDDSLTWIFSFEPGLFLRPGGLTVLLIEHMLWGTCAVGFRLVALLLHASSSLLVVATVRAISRDARAAWATGFLYAGSTSIHLDTMVWAVGIYELGMAFFALWCVLAFARGHAMGAALALVIALSFKETAIVVPGILAAMVMARVTESGRRLREWLPVAVMVVAWGLAKAGNTSPFSLPPDHPYAAALSGEHVLANAYRYVVWTVQSVAPVGSPIGGATTVLLLSALLVAVGLGLRRRLWDQLVRVSRPTSVFAAWALIGISPSLFLQHHAYRYYLTLALPGAVALCVLVVIAILESLRLTARKVVAAVAIGVSVSVGMSFVHLQRAMNEGIDQQSLVWGTNHVIERGRLVKMVRAQVVPHLAEAPADAVVVLQDVDLHAIGTASALRLWTGLRGLEVYDAMALRRDGRGRFWIEEEGSLDGPLAAPRIHVFRRRGGRIERVALDSWSSGRRR